MYESLAKHIYRRSSDDLRISVQARGIILLRIGTMIVEQLGWQPGQFCDLLIGSGEDEGLAEIRLVPDRIGWKLVEERPSRNVTPLRLKMSTIRKGHPSPIQGMPARLKPTAIPATAIDGVVRFQFPWHSAPDIGRYWRGGVEIVSDASLPTGTVELHHPDGRVDEIVNVGTPDIELRQDRPANLAGGAEVSRETAKPNASGGYPPRVDRLDPANWPDDVRHRFIEAAARGETSKVLADICERPVGSIYNLKIKLETAINKRRRQIDQERLSRAPAPATEPESSIPEAVFLYLTKKRIFPQLQGLGHVCGQNREKTKLMLNGEAMSPETFIREANRLLDLSGAEALKLPR